VAAVNENCVRAELCREYFTVHTVYRRIVRIAELGLWTLNHPNRCFLPVGATAEDEDRLSERIGSHNLVMDGIASDLVVCPPLKSCLAFNHSDCGGIPIRRTGECRNPWMAHSIGRQDLLPLWVVRQAAGSPKCCQCSILGGAADHAERSYITLSCSGKHI